MYNYVLIILIVFWGECVETRLGDRFCGLTTHEYPKGIDELIQ